MLFYSRLSEEKAIKRITAALIDKSIHFKNIPEKYKDNKEIAKCAIENDDRNIQYVSTRLLQDLDIVKIAIAKKAEYIHQIDAKFKTDKQLITPLLWSNPLVFEHLSDELKTDLDLIRVMIRIDAKYINIVPEQFKLDEAVALRLVQDNYQILQHLSSEFKHKKEFVLAAITRLPTHRPLTSIVPDVLFQDKNFIIDILKYNYEWFMYLPADLRQDEDIVLTVIKKYPEIYNKQNITDNLDSIQFAIKAVFTNKEVFSRLSLTKAIHPQIKWLRRHIDNITFEQKEYIKNTFLKYPNAFVYPDDMVKALMLGTPDDYMLMAQYAIMKHDKTKNTQSAVDEDIRFIPD